MTNELTSKRLTDDELEAVAGGVTPPTIDPSALSNLMHANVGALLGGGGAYTMDTSAPAQTDSGTPTITGQTHVVVPGDSLFTGESFPAGSPVQAEAPFASGTVTISGSLSLNIPAQPPEPTIEVMHIDPTPVWTKVNPTVSAEQEPPANGPHSVLSNSF